ncbi:MAG TPA: ATP-binding cassette domain-containing protein [Methylomirabilota bacterium]|nr:ATP-binding cassette domain-containing protein [Methylomirabilota bacterium]
MSELIIQIDDLLFRWTAGGKPCLEIPRFVVELGERIFLYGPSGSGKSTLLGLLGGVLVPERGSVRVMNVDLTRLSSSARDRFRADHIGFIFQQFNLVPYLSIVNNVLLPCQFSPRRRAQATAGGNSLHDEATRLLTQLDLDRALWKQMVTELSVGQQQRVAAARALIGRPEIVIADEPTSALDAERQAAFLELLAKECAHAGSTLLFVSHDRRLAAGFSGEIALSSINSTKLGAEA